MMMITNNAWGLTRAIPAPQLRLRQSFHCIDFSAEKSTNISLSFVLGRCSFPSSSKNKKIKHPKPFYCLCSSNSHDSDSTSSCLDWDWNRWTRHFSEIEQAESYVSVLKFQLEDAVEREDFEEAANLEKAIGEATSKDTVAEIMSQLKNAIDEERYHDASRLCRHTGCGLVGWWVAYSKDSDDPFGSLVQIKPDVGRFVARNYSPRQLVTSSPGAPLFEIFLVKDNEESYVMQVVHLQQDKGMSTNSASFPTKSTKNLSTSGVENESIVDVQGTKVKEERSEEKGMNTEGATGEGIKSIKNFLKEKIPGLKQKVMNIDITAEVMDDVYSWKQLMQDGEEAESSDSEGGADDLEEIQPDRVALKGASNASDNEKELDTKVFIGEVVHSNEDAPTKDEYVRMPADVKDMERDSFALHVPGRSLDYDTGESKMSKLKVAALAAQGVSELVPFDVAKAFWSSDEAFSKVSRDVHKVLNLAVSQVQKQSGLSEYTTFSRINNSEGNLDPLNGLYVGASGPYGAEVVQLRRKYGQWTGEGDKSSDVEFFEYVEAIKLTGDLKVPAGQVTFRAKIGKGSQLSNRGKFPDELGVVASYGGQGRIADFGFRNPRWVDGELLQFNGKGMGPYVKGADLGFLYVVPEQSFLMLFNRLNLPD